MSSSSHMSSSSPLDLLCVGCGYINLFRWMSCFTAPFAEPGKICAAPTPPGRETTIKNRSLRLPFRNPNWPAGCQTGAVLGCFRETRMPFVDTSSLNVIERLPGWYGRYFHSPSMTFAHYDFKRGSSIHEHFHPQEEVYEVIEGALEVTIANPRSCHAGDSTS
jgi:hypothetical protein